LARPTCAITTARSAWSSDGDGALVLEPGVLGRTNGVALLAEHGFDEAVQRRAEQVAAWLAQQRHRDASADVLA
jgi:hypothetical protein